MVVVGYLSSSCFFSSIYGRNPIRNCYRWDIINRELKYKSCWDTLGNITASRYLIGFRLSVFITHVGERDKPLGGPETKLEPKIEYFGYWSSVPGDAIIQPNWFEFESIDCHSPLSDWSVVKWKAQSPAVRAIIPL